MTSFQNYRYLYPPISLIIFLFYLFFFTGIHGDDYALIKELQGKQSLLIFTAENLGKYIYNIPSYLIWCSYALIGFENIFLYDLLKILLNSISIFFLYSFFKNYFSNFRSFFISFLIILFPTHDSSNYWLMATPLYIFFPSMIFYSFSLIKKNFYLTGSILLILSSFNYTSPPYVLGLSAIFLLEKNYKKFFFFFTIGCIYILFYLIISNIYENLEHRVDDYLSVFKIAINFIFQLITSIDANIGLSFFIKIFYSIKSIDIIGLIIAFFFIFALFIGFSDKISFFDNTVKKNTLHIFISMTLIYISSLFIFSLTSSYPQTTFNLGNRITIYSSFLFVILLSSIIRKNIFFVIISIILILSMAGISNHWKKFNQNNIDIINNINLNTNFNELNDNDLLFVKDNLYSKLGKIAHIEFLIIPWVNNKIFEKYGNFTVLPLSKYLYLDSGFVVDKKESNKYINNETVYIYLTESDELIKIKGDDLNKFISKENNIFRHWIQLKEFKLISNIIIGFFPRVGYLFVD